MASLSLAEVLGATQLTGLYQTVKPGIPNVWGPEFFQQQKTVNGNVGSYFIEQGNRAVAPETAYGSPSRQQQQNQISEVPIILSHTFNSLLIPITNLINLIKPDTSNGSDLMIDTKGVDEIVRQSSFAVQAVENRRTWLLNGMLATGFNYLDNTGQPLGSASGARTTINYQVPANNQNQCNGIFDASWDNATADIEQQLINLDQASVFNTGYRLARAYYGKNIPKWVTSNPKMAAYLARNATMNNSYLAKGRLTDLGDLTWLPAYTAFYQKQGVNPAAGAIVPQVGDNQIIFTPEPAPSWMGWVEGGYYVPQSIEISKDLKAQVSKFELQHGRFMWAESTTDAPGIKLLYGDTAIPVLNVPQAIYQATVVF